MEREVLERTCRQFSVLMEQGEAALRDRDLRTAETVARRIAAAQADLDRVWREAEQAGLLARDLALSGRLSRLVREALECSTRIEAGLRAWQDAIGRSLRLARQGSLTLAAYAGVRRDSPDAVCVNASA